MSGMQRKKSDDVFVFKKDGSFYSIKPYDNLILQEVRSSTVKFFLFPIRSVNGTKYYKEYPCNITGTMKLKITGDLSFCIYGSDILNIGDERYINLESHDIAETFSLLGSLRNLDTCCQLLDSYTGETQRRASLTNFEITIYSNGQEYMVNDEIYIETVPIDPDDIRYDATCILFYMEDVITYVEYALMQKRDDINLQMDSNYRYIMMDDKYDKFLIKDKTKIPDETIILSTPDKTIYYAIKYAEYKLTKTTHSAYTVSYVIYEDEPNTAQNDMEADELSVDVIMELDGVDFSIFFDDMMHTYSIDDMIFMMISAPDIIDILKRDGTYICEDDDAFIHVCLTYTLTHSLSTTHNALIVASVSDKNINERDVLYDMCTYVMDADYTHKMGGKNERSKNSDS